MSDHGHTHAAPIGRGHGKRLALVLAITSAALVVEVVGAAISGSLALLADAGHMLTDVAGLSLALVAANLARRPATDERTWGYRRAEVLAAAAQAAVLLAVGVFVLVEGIRVWSSHPRWRAQPWSSSGLSGSPATPSRSSCWPVSGATT